MLYVSRDSCIVGKGSSTKFSFPTYKIRKLVWNDKSGQIGRLSEETSQMTFQEISEDPIWV